MQVDLKDRCDSRSGDNQTARRPALFTPCVMYMWAAYLESVIS